MKPRYLLFGTVGAVVLVVSTFAAAQTKPDDMTPAGCAGMAAMMQQHACPMMGMAGHRHPMMMSADDPISPGQAVFGAVREIVQMLEADSNTDWSKVNLGALREHLIDMDEVTMRAVATETPVDGGLEVAVTGTGRTLAAIARMIPAHAVALNGVHGWAVTSASLPEGVVLTVTSTDPKEVVHIRGLGFIGLLASWPHHQLHHLAIAKAERHIH
jgi:hypothetical protein